MKVLITGGAGFIGYHLARYHEERGDSVYILDNFFKTSGKLDKELDDLAGRPNVHMIRVDLTRTINDINVPISLDIVYHLAAINGTQLFYEIPYEVARNNLLMTLNLLDWLEDRKVRRLIYTSSSEVYAGGEELGLLRIPTDENASVVFVQPTNPRFSYGTSKFMGEFLCFHCSKVYNMPVTVVRYHNIYGPRMGHRHVIPEFILRLKDGEKPFRIYGGSENRAFCYVDDAVQSTYLVATTSGCENEIIHIGNSAEEITIENLAGLLMDLFCGQFEIMECGHRSGSVSRRCPDTSKLQMLTGFKAKVDLKKGLSKTLDWYINHSDDF